ncbi:MAG: zf-HC2 domain-containing protein [Clostridia bacterium]|jgi:hypothetical protein|nr:zf-HC2 domain-containing protein [Clostridia bacterium]
MDCNIVKDLIPLYIDDCCSEESAEEVKRHLDGCAECKAVFDEMSCPTTSESVSVSDKPLKKINDWKASVLQSVLFFASFLLITFGVAAESSSQYTDYFNGFWAIWLVAPVTGFMFSLPNWYFIKFYKDRKSFSRWTCALTLLLIVAATTWTLFHYDQFVTNSGLLEFLKSCLTLGQFIFFICPYHLILTAVLVLFSKVTSSKYAQMLGKE